MTFEVRQIEAWCKENGGVFSGHYLLEENIGSHVRCYGDYISVYCNLRNVHVRKGQRVSTRQSLGTVGQDNILQFQLRKETAKLNPESWLGR